MGRNGGMGSNSEGRCKQRGCKKRAKVGQQKCEPIKSETPGRIWRAKLDRKEQTQLDVYIHTYVLKYLCMYVSGMYI